MNFVMFKKYDLTGSQEDEYFVSGVSRSNKPDFNLATQDLKNVVTGHSSCDL